MSARAPATEAIPRVVAPRPAAPGTWPAPVQPEPSPADAPRELTRAPRPAPTGRQAAARARRRTAPVAVRRLKLTSVAKVSIIFYLIVAIVWVIAVMILWSFADSTGAVRSLDKAVRTLFDLKTFTIHTGTVAGYTALAGVVLAIAGTVVNVLAAAIYNIISRVAGGLRIEFESPADPDQTAV